MAWHTISSRNSVNFTSKWYSNGKQSKQLMFISCVRESPSLSQKNVSDQAFWVVQIKLTVSKRTNMKTTLEIQFQTMFYPQCLTAKTWFDIISFYHAIPNMAMVNSHFFMIPCFQLLPYYVKAWILIRYNRHPPPSCCWHYENIGKQPKRAVENVFDFYNNKRSTRRRLSKLIM